MDGVSIVVETTWLDAGWEFLCAISIIMALGGLVFLLYSLFSAEWLDALRSGVICLVGAVGITLICTLCVQKAYKVVINPSVSMDAFYEYYDVREQEGMIFTVTEKK